MSSFFLLFLQGRTEFSKSPCVFVDVCSHTAWQAQEGLRLLVCACLVTKLFLTIFTPMDCIPSVSSVHGILQARVLEGVAISSPRGSSCPRDQTCVIGRQSLSTELPGKPLRSSITYQTQILPEA